MSVIGSANLVRGAACCLLRVDGLGPRETLGQIAGRESALTDSSRFVPGVDLVQRWLDWRTIVALCGMWSLYSFSPTTRAGF